MNKVKLLAFSLFVLFTACKEEMPSNLLKEGNVPAPVINAQVKPLAGGGKITYQLPTDPDLLYVKAIFESPKGNFREVKASLYADSIIIDGLGTTEEYDIKLYAVTRSEIQSEPVSVKFRPLASPISATFPSLKMIEDFGGVTVDYLNPTGEQIIINILKKDALDKWEITETLYTTQKSGTFSKTGLPDTPADFGVFITDRWKNTTDTLFKTLTPLFEQKLDKSLFKPLLVNNFVDGKEWRDNINFYLGTYTLSKLWDESLLESPIGLMHTITSSGPVVSFTIDLGKVYKLSRFKYFMRGVSVNPSNLFNTGNPEVWEIQGSADGTTWVKMMDCVAVKPSGLPLGTTSAEDKTLAIAGLDYKFPASNPPVKYIRWLNKKVFGTSTFVHIQELTFWGK